LAGVCPVAVEGNAAILLAKPVLERPCPVLAVRAPAISLELWSGSIPSKTATLSTAGPVAPNLIPAQDFSLSAPDFTTLIQSPGDEPFTITTSPTSELARPMERKGFVCWLHSKRDCGHRYPCDCPSGRDLPRQTSL